MASWNDLQAARQNDLMRYYNSEVVQQDQATPQNAALQEKKNKGGFFGGVGYTLEKLGLGALRSIEGMTDYLVGGAADILGQDDFAEELMKSDWVNYEHADEWYNPNKVMSFVGDVSSGVGGMLPSITAAAAVTLATGGAGAGVGAGLLSQGVGTALFGLGAAGQSTSQAVKETGTLGGKEWLYGTGSGALEAGIEAASGGIGGTLAGTAFGKQLAKTTGGKIATTFLGEGLEEVASDWADPLLKRATGVDKNAKLFDITSGDDWKKAGRTFLVGGTTGAVLGGAGRAINAAKAGGFNNLNAAENTQKLVEQKAEVNLQQVEGKGFEETSTKKAAPKQTEQTAPTEQKANVEQPTQPTQVVQAAQPTQTGPTEPTGTQAKVETVETTKKTKAAEKPIKAEYTPEEIAAQEQRVSKNLQKMDEKTRLEFMESNSSATRNFNEDGTLKPSITVTQEELDTYDKDAYSASLKGHEGELKFRPAKKAAQAVKSIMKNLTKLTQGKAEIVLTDDDLGTAKNGKKINAVVSNGVVYLKSDATDTERTMFLGSHEIMHTLEGTREYSNLAKFIQSEIKNNPRMRLKYNLDDYISAYAGAQEQNYSNYTKMHEAQTEMYADFVANEILSNPDSVNRLVKDNRNLVKKMLDWVKTALKRIGMTKDERETYNTLRQMEKVLFNALEAGRGGMALDAVERRYQERKAQEQAQETAKEKPFRGTFAAERFSVQVVDGEEVVVIDTDQDIFEGQENSDYPKIVRQYMLDKFKNKVLPIGSKRAYIKKDSLKEYAYPADRRIDAGIKAAKMKAGTELDNLLKVAEYIEHQRDDGRHPDAVRGWDKYKTKFIVDGYKFEGKISIKLTQRGDVFYDITKIKDITSGTNGKDLLSQSASRRSDVDEGKPSTPIINEKTDLSSENAKKVERFSVDLDDISDFDAITFAKWFDELTIEDLEELIGDNAETEIETIEKLPTKQERRDAYVARMYKQGNLNEAITKIVKKHPQMQAYFKNTKVNQKYNPLYRTKGDEYIVMFHGTPSTFNVFDTKKIGKHGTVMGSGLYFTESLGYAEDYKTNDGRVMATLLNIEKPLSRNKITMTKEDLKRFIREVVDMDGEDFLSNYGDVYSLGYEKLLDKTVNKLYDYHTNEADMIEDIYVTSRMDFDDFHNGLTDLLGYDGIIAWNKAEGTQAVVFRSNQVKDIFNFNPTKSEDVRYALTVKKYYNPSQIGAAYNAIEHKVFDLYSGIEKGVANDIALEYGATVYFIDADKDGKLDWGIYRKRVIPNKAEREQVIKITNLEAAQNGRVANQFFEKLGIDGSQYSGRNLNGLQGNNAQGVKGKSQHNKAGVSKADGNRAVRVRLTNPEDVAYLNAVKRGDMDKAQAMVDKAAEEAGYTIKAYHGSRNIFTVFDKAKLGSNTKTETSKRWFFAADEQTANSYYPYGVMKELYKKTNQKMFNPEALDQSKRGKLYSLYLKFDNPLTVDVADYDYASHREKADAWMEYVEEAERNGNDGIILLNAMDNQLNTSARESTVYMFRTSSQAKSAEPVTYDDDGNVIPLSKRFNLKNEDIRYSLDVENAEAEYMTDEEWEATLEKEHEDDGRVAKFQRVTQEKEKLSKKERIEKVKATVADAWLRGQIETTNQQAGIEHAGKKLGVDLEPKIQKARASQSAAINMVTNEQRDYTGKKRVGKSIEAIFGPIIKQGDKVYDDFLEYLGHFHNIDSMSMEDKAKAEIIKLVRTNEALAKIVKQKNINETERKQKLQAFEEGRRYLELSAVENKPVYGWSVSAEESKERIQELNEKYKDFFAKAQEVWGYNKNLIQRRVDAGLITQELGDELLARYPHYIPTFRDTSKSGVATTGTSNSKNAVEVRKTIRTRKGSSADIIDVMLSMSKQTQAVLRAEAVTDLANALYDAAEAQNDFTDIEIISKTKVQDEAKNSEEGDIDYEAEKPKNNEVVFYRDGERIVAAVSQPVFVGFESFNGSVQFKGPLVGLLEKWMNIFKSSVTAWNPLFTIRNFIRDFQEAAFYTKHGVGKFSANLPKAIAAMKRKSDLWQQYLAIGGIQSGFFDKDTGIFDSSGKIKKGLKAVGGKISLINEFVEQIPRFNEFMLSVESGKSIEQALLDSADVTTNFSRGGKLTKVANRTLFPFLNASVQGFSKLWRTVSGRKAAREWASLIVKATLFGLSVGLINDLINGDDEEYEKLNMREKENNYILKAGDVFIKIPKGRVVAFLGSFVGRTKDFVSGKEDAFDEWGTSAMSMVTPVDSVTRTIFAPFSDVKSNTTWYGGQIEGQRLQNYAPSQRYDESTSSIAIALGKVFNYSPKKIHYLIDQYSGVFGDVLLPLTTNKAERGMIESAFTIDPVTQNNISNEFYDTLDSLTWAKNAGDPISAILLRYMNKASNGVSELYQQKRDIANDKSLSNKEKQEQTRILQATINGTLNAATQSVEKLEQILIDSGYEKQSIALMQSKAFLAFDEKQQTSATQKFTDHFYAKAMEQLVGENNAPKVLFFDEIGAVESSIYLTEIAAITSEKDANGKTIPNSRKEKVHAYIEKLKISALNKYILMYLAGYIPSENGKAKIQQYLIGKGYKQEEVKNLWN